ncbi:TonB-dependent receptor [Pedobacter sp.]|uniref:TonB-dependent receptor n=1 Tax=Pedobacter sp. TaxID=1411316 RepID=UPI003C34FC38
MKLRIFFTLICFCSAANAFGQVIRGTVKTKEGNPVHLATVSVLNNNLSTASGKDGRFTLNLSSGSYQLSVTAVGFATQIRSVKIEGNDNIDLNFVLQQSSQELNEVMVSAEKKQQNVQNVPAAVSVLDRKAIQEYRLWDITNLTAIAPNLFTVEHGNSTSSNFFNIRGVMGFSNEQAVATYVDGVYQSDYFSAPPLFNDVESIEILRGPQGTLYGRNAFGGVVNITTRQPGNTLAGFAEMTFGNYGQQRYTAGLSGPIVKDKLFASGSFSYNHRGSIYQNAFTNSGFDRREDYSGNFSLRYLPSARWSLALNLKAENDNDRGSFPWVGSIEDVFSRPYQVNTNNTNIERRKNSNASLAANYYGKDFTFTAVSSYTDFHGYYEGRGVDYDFSPLDALSTAPDICQRVFAQELRFSSPTTAPGKLKWVAGAYGFTQKNHTDAPTFYGIDYLQFDPASGAPFTTIGVSDGRNKGYAFFGQATYTLAEKLDFTAGLRYDHESRKLGQYTDLLKDPGPVVLFSPNQDFSAQFNAYTPKFVLSYKLQEHMLLYGSYARGFRSGGLNTNATDPAKVPYQPEHSDNYEIGWKNMFFQNRLKLNLTAFYLQQHNQQISTAMDGINALILNVGEMHNKGLELELTALPVKGLQVDWNASYSNARYRSLLLYSNDAQAVVDFRGDQPINTPPVSSMLAAQYTYGFARSKQHLSVYLRGEYRYLGKYYFDFINDKYQPGYSLFNLKTGISTGRMELSGWMRNVTDTRYVAYGSFGSFLLGMPRTYGLSLTTRI